MIRTTLMVTVVVCLACSFYPQMPSNIEPRTAQTSLGAALTRAGRQWVLAYQRPLKAPTMRAMYRCRQAGGLTNNEATGGGVTEGPYSSYNPGNASGLSGGGLDDETQVPAASPRARLAPNGETYRSLGISGY